MSFWVERSAAKNLVRIRNFSFVTHILRFAKSLSLSLLKEWQYKCIFILFETLNMQSNNRYYVYIMTNKSGTLYIGLTNNLKRRVYQHKNKKVEGFTKKYNINKLIYFEVFGDIYSAIAREKTTKGWLRKKKIELIKSSNPDWRDLSPDWYEWNLYPQMINAVYKFCFKISLFNMYGECNSERSKAEWRISLSSSNGEILRCAQNNESMWISLYRERLFLCSFLFKQ